MKKFLNLNIWAYIILLASCGSNDPVVPTNPIRKGNDLIYGNGAPPVKVLYERVFEKNRPNRKPVVMFSHWDKPDPDLDAVYVFVDGESIGPKHYPHLLSKMLYIGPIKNSGAKESFDLPFISLSFSERSNSPLDLLRPITSKGSHQHFCAYLASNCVKHREDAFNELVEFARRNNLGEVHAVGKCHGSHPETKVSYQGVSRTQLNYMDGAVEIFGNYKYAMAFENDNVDGYVTEKIVSPLLAGTVPIYWGSPRVLDIIDPQSFIYVKPGTNFTDVLDVANFTNQKRNEMLGSPKLRQEALYLFSWHPDIEIMLQNRGEQTIGDALRALVQKF